MWTIIITLLKNPKNIVILVCLVFLIAASGACYYYKIRYNNLIIKTQKEQIAQYETAMKEIEKHTKRANVLITEKQKLEKQIDKLNIQGKKHDESYYAIIDDISGRFNRGL